MITTQSIHETIGGNYTPQFNLLFSKLLKIEGGHVNDADETAGGTRYGLTEKIARRHGYEGSMQKLPLEVAKHIYKVSYWDKLQLDQVGNIDICQELFDSCVNVGTRKTIEWLQISLNVNNDRGKRWEDVASDGVMGRATLAALETCCKNRFWTERVLKALNCLQGAFYITVASRRIADQKFIADWFDSRVRI